MNMNWMSARGSVFGLAMGAAFALFPENAKACTIVIGESGNSWTITETSSSVPASSFIRSTSGTCHFRVYNSANFTGSNVVIGTDLGERIRAGTDGIENKDDGGGETWRIRSVRFLPFPASDSQCTIRIGGNGVRMTYRTPIGGLGTIGETLVDAMPGMDKVSWYVCNTGGDHRVHLYNETQFDWPRVEYTPFTGSTRTLPFRARSMNFW